MKRSIKKGFGFGITSGIITTLGLMVGLYSGTNSRGIVLGGILMIAIADAMSDALGIHLSEEADNNVTEKEVWESTISTFLFKLVFALIFAVPVLFLGLQTAIIFSIVLGLFLLSIFSYAIARHNGAKPIFVIMEHLIIAILVITVTYFVGELAGTFY